MIGQSLVDAFGKDLNKSFGSLPGSTGKGAGVFAKVASAAGIDSSGPYTGESYDAAALANSAYLALPGLSVPGTDPIEPFKAGPIALGRESPIIPSGKKNLLKASASRDA